VWESTDRTTKEVEEEKRREMRNGEKKSIQDAIVIT
jgi:hypothetical protein